MKSTIKRKSSALNPTAPGLRELWQACERGDEEQVRLRLTQGYDINRKSSAMQSRTAVHIAAAHGHTEICRLLVAAGANVRLSDERSDSAMHLAVQSGSLECCEYLTGLNRVPVSDNSQAKTPMVLAIDADRGDICKALNKGFYDYRFDVVRGDVADSLLTYAMKKEKWSAFEALMDMGASIETRTQNGDTPLQVAIDFQLPLAMEMLLDRGADPSVLTRWGMTPHFNTVRVDRLDMLETLVKHRPSLSLMELRTLDGRTLLHHAAHLGAKNVVRYLLDYGFDVNEMTKSKERGNDEGTCLHSAVSGGQADVCALLLERGADPEIRSLAGRTAFELAQHVGASEVAMVLRSHQARVHLDDALYRAVAAPKPEM